MQFIYMTLITYILKSITNHSIICKNVNVWCSFQLPVVAPFPQIREPSPPHFTRAFILLLWTASGPSRFAPLPLSPTPPLPEPFHTAHPPPSPCLACHERDAEAALLLSTSSIFICQTAVSAAVLAGLRRFVCFVEFVGVCKVCAVACVRSHGCGFLCTQFRVWQKRQSPVLPCHRSLLGARYGWSSPCSAWKSLEWTRVCATKTMWKLWTSSKKIWLTIMTLFFLSLCWFGLVILTPPLCHNHKEMLFKCKT